MDDWIDRLAATLGEESLSQDETLRLLEIARDVAHRVERKITPLAAFLAGSAVGRRLAAGTARDEALADVIGSVEAILPPAPSEDV